MKQILLFLALLLPVCAFSQLNDTFDGTDVPPHWKGEGLPMFSVDNGRLLYDGTGRTGKYEIYTEVDYAKDMEWEFDVELGYKPSSSNYARFIVLVTGKPDNDDMYYLSIGYSKQNISLREWDTTKALIDGRTMLDAPPSSVRVKLTLEDRKRWTLYTRMEGEAAFYKEGVYEKAEVKGIGSRGNIYIRCYSEAKTLKGMFTYFDNFRVASEVTPTDTIPKDPVDPENPDPSEPDTDPTNPPGTAPSLRSIEQEEASELLLSFDKPVMVEGATFLLNNIGEPDEIYISDDDLWVKLVWEAAWQKGKTYELIYSGVVDKKGNECKGRKSFVSLYGSDPNAPNIPPGAIRINEVMADPKGAKGLPETEYVELRNTSQKALQLEDCTFLYGDKTAVALSSCLLPADGYVVLFREGRKVAVDKGGLQMPLAKFPSALANTGKAMELMDSNGKTIDKTDYPKAKSGVAWERQGSAWALSSDPRGGTPGAVNSSGTGVEPEEPEEPENPDDPDEPEEPEDPDEPEAPSPSAVAPSDVVFNELLPEPFVGGSEYIELYNRSAKSLSIAGLSVAIRKSDGTLSTHYPLSSVSSVLPAGGYVLLTKAREGVTSFYLVSAPKVVHELKLPVLANTFSTLVLFRAADKVVIDEVSYSAAWHSSSVKSKKGVALERLSPDARTQDGGNWTSAAESAGFGTPGYRNSQYKQESSGGTTGIEAPVFIDATGLYSIAYHLDEPGYSCRANVFDLSGRSVAQIANHALLGVEGTLSWDGIATDGARLGTGIYILYVEIYHSNGKTQRYKKAFPVR